MATNYVGKHICSGKWSDTKMKHQEEQKEHGDTRWGKMCWDTNTPHRSHQSQQDSQRYGGLRWQWQRRIRVQRRKSKVNVKERPRINHLNKSISSWWCEINGERGMFEPSKRGGLLFRALAAQNAELLPALISSEQQSGLCLSLFPFMKNKKFEMWAGGPHGVFGMIEKEKGGGRGRVNPFTCERSSGAGMNTPSKSDRQTDRWTHRAQHGARCSWWWSHPTFCFLGGRSHHRCCWVRAQRLDQTLAHDLSLLILTGS